MAVRTASPGRRGDPVATGTVVGTTVERSRAYTVGAVPRVIAAALLLAGLTAAAVAVLSSRAAALWVLPGAVVLLSGALAGLSLDSGATGWWPRLGAAIRRAASPRPVPVRDLTLGRHLAEARRFDLLNVDGTRVSCEFFGGERRRSPQAGQLAQVYGRREPDGTVRVRRIVYDLDGTVFRPRADLGFALVRLTTGAATVLGALVTVAALIVLTLRRL